MIDQPRPGRPWAIAEAFRRGATVEEIHRRSASTPGSCATSRSWSRWRPRSPRGARASAPPGCAPRSRPASRTCGSPRSGRCSEGEVRALRRQHGVRPVYKRVDTCGAEFEAHTPYLYSTYEDECEARPTRAPEDHDPRRRAEPDRAGHRVRLLLRARGLRAARRRLRDDHGELQPRDRLDRLRHQRPALLRAAHARGRARDRRAREAARRDRAVRRPDAAAPRGGAREERRADPRHLARRHRPRRGPRALRRSCSRRSA